MQSAHSLLLLRLVLPALAVLSLTTPAASAADREKPHMNAAGAPVHDASGQPIIYDRDTYEAMLHAATAKAAPPEAAGEAAGAELNGFVPAAQTGQQPFWQYAIFGSAIGASNIVIAPAANGVAPEIVIGGNSSNHFGGDDFWQVLRRNAATGNYDQIFVSPLYTSTVKRILLGNVTGDTSLELAVMLANGRVYLYDFATKAELGYLTTGVTELEGLSLTDLNADGVDEVIVTNTNDLFVLSGAGNLLWQVAGAGGADVVVGQMDNDPALEIAATKGTVVDAGTKTIQWTRTGGFGRRVRLAPFAGETYQQLIVAESWYYIYSYDVQRQLPRWSIRTSHDIGALRIADVDNDNVPEVIYGDYQSAAVHVHDLNTQARKWGVTSSDSGSTDVAVADVDNDGVAELLWGSGWSSTGADHLFIHSTTGTRAVEWQSVDLQGPFAGPAIGDLDGDNKQELVICSASSDSDYNSGRILVFDLETMAFRGISPPVVNNYSWTGVRDLKLRDAEGDGRLEILIGGDYLYDGAAEIWSFSAGNTFTKQWANTTRPEGSPFNFVDLVDINGDNTPELIAGNGVDHTGSEGVYVYIYNYPATTNPWRSVNLASGFGGVTGLIVQDLDKIGGAKEIAALVSTGDLYTFNGPSRQLRDLRQATGARLLSNRATPLGIVAADNNGLGRFLRYGAEDYTESFSRQLNNGPLTGISVLPDGTMWSGTGSSVLLHRPPAYSPAEWQTPAVGTSVGRFVAREVRGGQQRMFSSGRHSAFGFIVPHQPITWTGAASRKTHVDGGLDVSFSPGTQSAVECRTGGANGDHTVVFTFNNDIVSAGAAISDGPGAIAGAPIFAGNTVLVNLTNVPDGRLVTISLSDVTDSFGAVLPSAKLSIGFLVGDTNGDGAVNSGDALQVRNRSGQAVTWANSRFDVNRDGAVNAGDALVVRSRSGRAIE